MLRKDKLVGAIVYYDGMFPLRDFYYTVLYLGRGGREEHMYISCTDSPKGRMT